jgi:hypothetical protein
MPAMAPKAAKLMTAQLGKGIEREAEPLAIFRRRRRNYPVGQ